MKITTAHLTSKGQVTVPAWVREKLGVKPNMEIAWVEFKPGEITIVAKKPLGKNPIDALCGILKGKGADHISLVDSLIEDGKKDLELEDKAL